MILKKHFQQYGKVEYVRLLKDRRSGESKGLAFVNFYRACYHCALALEQCDANYKAVFAAPKDSGNSRKRNGMIIVVVMVAQVVEVVTLVVMTMVAA